MRAAKSTLTAAAVLGCAALSLIHPWGDLRADSSLGGAILKGSSVPEDVRSVLVRKCGDCHSNNTRWPAYSKVAPASWLIEHDVHEGREHLNLSQWEQYGVDTRVDLLARISTEIRQGKMPLRQYVMLHPEARLTDPERTLIREWVKAERKRLMSQESGR